MEFHTPSLEDKSEVDSILKNSPSDCCEFCFGNIYMWSDIYKCKINCDNGILLSKVDGENVYCYPVGKGDKKSIIESLKKEHKSFTLYGLTEKDKLELESFFPNEFEIVPDRDSFDYIYRAEDLANLSGKKYHSKKNHVSYFKKNFTWHFEEITPENIGRCKILNDQWECLNRQKEPEEIANEHSAINKAFDKFFELEFFGGILFIEDEAVAFTFGEKLNENTFCTHVEKAYANFRGAYQTVNCEFAKLLLEKNYEFINREEDTGSEGLRQAKLSYHPSPLLTKYSAIYKG